VLLFSAVCGFAIFKIANMESKAKAINGKWIPSLEIMGWFYGVTFHPQHALLKPAPQATFSCVFY